MDRRKATCGFLLATTCWLFVPFLVRGQEESPGGAAQEEVKAGEPEPFDVEAVTRAYLAKQSPEEKERSDSYFEGGYWLRLWGFLYGLGVAWLLLGTRCSAKMRDLGRRVTRFRAVSTALYAVQYILATTVLGFPLALYQGYFREHRYGLATQGFGGWMRDQAAGLGVELVLMPILLVALYAVFRRAPRTWWVWGAVVGLVFLVLVILIAPVYIAPLFNDYKALEDPAVVDPILQLARGNGVAVDHVYQFDASRQSTRISANVSGFLGTLRISLNDNLLNRCTLPEVKAVMAHEIGHYVLNHIYESIVFFAVVLTLAFAFVRFGFEAARSRWGERWGVEGISDVAGLPLLSAVFSVFFLLATPVMNTYIRVNEAEADIFGLNAAREPDGFAEAALKVGEYRKLDPGPFEEWFFFDHPSGRSRIEMAMRWKAEHLDEQTP